MAHFETTAGVNVPLTASFADSAGTAVDPDADPVYTIYNQDRKILQQTTLTASHKTATGAYTLNYAPPKSVLKLHETEAELYAEALGTVSGVASVGARHTITVIWSE